MHWRLQSGAKRLEEAEKKAGASEQQSKHAAALEAEAAQQQAQVQKLNRLNQQLQDKLKLSESLLAEANIQQQQQQQHMQADRTRCQLIHDQSDQQLQQQLRDMAQQNDSLCARHTQLETELQSAQSSLADAQQAQQAAEETHTCTDAATAAESSLQGQVDSLRKENGTQAQHCRKLEGEVRALQQQLHEQMRQQQQSMQRVFQTEAVGTARVAVVQQQAEMVAGENVALQAHCKQLASDLAQSQRDVQVCLPPQT